MTQYELKKAAELSEMIVKNACNLVAEAIDGATGNHISAAHINRPVEELVRRARQHYNDGMHESAEDAAISSFNSMNDLGIALYELFSDTYAAKLFAREAAKDRTDTFEQEVFCPDEIGYVVLPNGAVEKTNTAKVVVRFRGSDYVSPFGMPFDIVTAYPVKEDV